MKDSANPENEGQVKLYKFGKKIFDKITVAMQPEFEDEEPINPFDFERWRFKLKIKQVGLDSGTMIVQSLVRQRHF